MFAYQSPNRLFKLAPIIYRQNANSTYLTDSFGRQHDYLRISLTERCNLRCQYCMPEEGVKLSKNENILTANEIQRLANLFVKHLNVRKIRLTGGEPLIRKDIIEIIKNLDKLKSNGLKFITMTTNATLLKRNCESLKNAGLDGVNISLDTLEPAKYEFITRRLNSFKSVLNGLKSALDQEFPLPVKINCVVMKGLNDDELIDFVEFTRDKAIDVRFIEYMPFDANKWTNKKLLPYEEMLKIIRNHYGDKLEKLIHNNKFNLTSKPFKIRNYQGQIGFITSMTNNFCSSCNRLRITADGNLKVCLFDQNEILLRDELRKPDTSNSDLIRVINSALQNKKAKHSGAQTIAKTKNRPMILIVSSSKPNQLYEKITHLKNGRLNMVDISDKKISKREACSQVKIELGKNLFNLIKLNQIDKGDIFTIIKMAGNQASKQTSSLIPLCHQLNLSKVDVEISLNESDYSLSIMSTVKLVDRTGAEMESLVCSAIAALTLYDMCKAVNKCIKITDLKLVRKSGGKSGIFVNEKN